MVNEVQVRQLAAIMFTDIVGYTALMDTNEELAFAILQKNRSIHKPRIEQFHGKFLKEMGDGILASFTTVTDAVYCAGAIQKACENEPELNLRIGIHQGEVVSQGEDVFGSGVNIASRIEAIAPAGRIWVSDSVQQNIQNKKGIEIEFIKEATLKNVKQAVKIYEIEVDPEYAPPRFSEDPSGSSELSIANDKSIAVLPFVNMSSDPEQEYFSDGMSEEIINKLSQIEDLRVIARTSTFAFKGKDEDMREIGRKLNVGHLLEGSVRKAGNRLRITAQLISATDGSHVWSQSFDREMENATAVFDIQDEISLAIVDHLKVELIGKEKKAIEKRYTENLEAYELFLQGLSYWDTLTLDGLSKAITYYEQSLQKDPNFVLAYAGIARAYTAMPFYGNLPANTAFPKAKTFVNKALELDKNYAWAHGISGYISMVYDWDFKAAELEFKKALDLNPNSARIRIYYSQYLYLSGRHKEAITEAKLAVELDPLNAWIKNEAATAFQFAGQNDRAINEHRQNLLSNPYYFLDHFKLGVIYLEESRLKDTIIHFEKAVELSAKNPMMVLFLATGYYLNGELDKSKKLYNSMELKLSQEYIPPLGFFVYHLTQGNYDQAYKWLEKAIDERDSFLPWFILSPIVRNAIQDEQRFQDLLKKAGF